MTNWWDEHRITEAQMLDWCKDSNAPSKILVREHIKKMGYASVLDCGAGLTSDYGCKNYAVIDTCEQFVERARALGVNATLASVEAISAPDHTVDVVVIRHVLEHLTDFRAALSETLRVAAREVIIVFFLPPGETATNQVIDGLDHRRYCYDDVAVFIKQTGWTFTVQHIGTESIWHVT